jgi:hypothetical protein
LKLLNIQAGTGTLSHGGLPCDSITFTLRCGTCPPLFTGCEAWGGIEPDFADTRMASIPLGSGTLIFDAADMDTFATIGFETEGCQEDCARLVERGATILEGPTDRPWGARTAYIQGPGELRFELEQVLGGSR